jgi:hypothetical protein
MRFRYDENMRRCLGMDIPKSYKLFIPVNNISGYFAGDNPAKNTFHEFKILL